MQNLLSRGTTKMLMLILKPVEKCIFNGFLGTTSTFPRLRTRRPLTAEIHTAFSPRSIFILFARSLSLSKSLDWLEIPADQRSTGEAVRAASLAPTRTHSKSLPSLFLPVPKLLVNFVRAALIKCGHSTGILYCSKSADTCLKNTWVKVKILEVQVVKCTFVKGVFPNY